MWRAQPSHDVADTAPAIRAATQQDAELEQTQSKALGTGVIFVGRHQGPGPHKKVILPYDNLKVDPKPVNEQGWGWRDRFKCQVHGRELTVWRLDSGATTWGQELKLKYSPMPEERTSNPVAMPITYGMKVKMSHWETEKTLHPTRRKLSRGSGHPMVACVEDDPNSQDWWFFKPQHGEFSGSRNFQPVKNGDIIRLEHVDSHYNLHSHEDTLCFYDAHNEVTCSYKRAEGDHNDDWRVECIGVIELDKPFRLIHDNTGHALHSHPWDYPCWPGQQQVTGCQDTDDNSVFWKICDAMKGTDWPVQLWTSLESENLTKATELIRDDPHVQSWLKKGDTLGRTPLHRAMDCDGEVHRNLIRSIMYVRPSLAEARDTEGSTPLHCAIESSGNRTHSGALAAIADIFNNLQSETRWMEIANNKGDPPLHTALHRALSFIDPEANDEVHLEENVFFAILRACPKAAQVKDTVGRLPLSICLSKEGTEEYTAALIDAYPDAKNDPDIAPRLQTMTTPLHLAMANKEPLETVTSLLRTNPEFALQKNYTGETPLHLGLRNGASPAAIAVLSRETQAATVNWTSWKHHKYEYSAKSPLAYAMVTNADVSVIQALAKACPAAAILQDDMLHEGLENHQDVEAIIAVLNASPTAPRLRGDGPGRERALRTALSVGTLSKAILKIIDAYPETVRTKDFNSDTPLHLAMRWKSPVEVVQAMLKVPTPPGGLGIARIVGDRGNLPLHVGLSSGTSAESIKAVLHSYTDATATRNVNDETPLHVGMKCKAPDEAIELVLGAQPVAASLEAPDGGGDTPLELGFKHNASKHAMAIVLHAYPRAARRMSEEALLTMQGWGILTRHELGHAFADRPVGEDTLGASRLARAVVDIHTRKIEDAMLPSNIAVYAEWGSGKSFVKNKMKEAFNAVNFEEKDKNYRFIQLEFNAWVYNGGDSIWAALVNHLIDGITSISQPHEFQAHMNDVDLWLLKTKRSVIYLAAIAIFLGLVIFAFLLAFDVIGPDIENVAGFTVVFAAFGAIGSAAASVGKVWGQVQKPVNEILFGQPKDPHYTAELGLMGDVKDKFSKMLGFLEIQNRKAEDRRRDFVKNHLLALIALKIVYFSFFFKMDKVREDWKKRNLEQSTEANIRKHVDVLTCSEAQLKERLISWTTKNIQLLEKTRNKECSENSIRHRLAALTASEAELKEYIRKLLMSKLTDLLPKAATAAKDIERRLLELESSEPEVQELLVTLIISKIRNACVLNESDVKDVRRHLSALTSTGAEIKKQALALSTIHEVFFPMETDEKSVQDLKAVSKKMLTALMSSEAEVKKCVLDLTISQILAQRLPHWEREDVEPVVNLMRYEAELLKTETFEKRAKFLRLLRAVAHDSDPSSSSVAINRVDRDTQEAIKAAKNSRDELEKLEEAMFTEEERHPKLPLDCRIVRFVIYVDDLDRCSNGKSVEILEAVQLLFNEVSPAMASAGSMTEFSGWMRLRARLYWQYRLLSGIGRASQHSSDTFDTYDVERDDARESEEQSDEKPPFITIFMIDPRIVVQDIMVRFGSTLKQAGINGYQFLDKIVQTPICLPKPAERPRQYMISHLMSGYLSTDDSPNFTIDDGIGRPANQLRPRDPAQRGSLSSGETAEEDRGCGDSALAMPRIQQRELMTALNPTFYIETDNNRTNGGSTVGISAMNALPAEEEGEDEENHRDSTPAQHSQSTLVPSPSQSAIDNEGAATSDAAADSTTSEARKIGRISGDTACDSTQSGTAKSPITNLPKDGFDTFERENVNAHATYLDANPRRIKRILNIYNYTREIFQSMRRSQSADVATINEEFQHYMSSMGLTAHDAMKQRFLRVLFRWVTMSEQWPFRTTLMVQMMSDDAQRPGGRDQLYGGREQTVAWQSKWVRAETHDQHHPYLIRLGRRVEFEHTTSEGLFQERLQRFNAVVAACQPDVDSEAEKCVSSPHESTEPSKCEAVRIELLDKVTLAVVSVTSRSHTHPILKCLRERMPAQVGILHNVVKRQLQCDSAFGIDVSKLSVESCRQLIESHSKVPAHSTKSPEEQQHSTALLNSVMAELFPHVSKAINIPLKEFFMHEVQHYVYKFSESVELKSTTEADASALMTEFNDLSSLDSDPEIFDAILSAPFKSSPKDVPVDDRSADWHATVNVGAPDTAEPGRLAKIQADIAKAGAETTNTSRTAAMTKNAFKTVAALKISSLKLSKRAAKKSVTQPESIGAVHSDVPQIAALTPDPYRPITLEECYFLARHFSFNLNPAILSSLQRLIRGRPHYDKGRNEFRKRGSVELFYDVGSL